MPGPAVQAQTTFFKLGCMGIRVGRDQLTRAFSMKASMAEAPSQVRPWAFKTSRGKERP